MIIDSTVVCDPPCDNGVCVDNDTCHCAAGYEGDLCTEEGTYKFIDVKLNHRT